MGKRVLVADSDSVVQQVVSYFLNLEGFEVSTAGDGVAALEVIEKFLPEIILLDPNLTGINGIEVSRLLKEKPQFKKVPILFLARSEEPLLNDVKDISHEFGIINKPIDPTNMVNTIRECIEKREKDVEETRESLISIEELLGWETSEKVEPAASDILESEIKTLESTEDVETDLRNKITIDMIENMVKKIAMESVEKVSREVIPEIAEREIKREIERLKSGE